MALVTLADLTDAAVDAQTLEDVVNGGPVPGTVTSRLGRSLKTIAKIVADFQAAGTGVLLAPTLITAGANWGNFNSGAKARKSHDSIVTLEGILLASNASASYNAIGTLPAGAAPSVTRTVPASVTHGGGHVACVLIIGTDGAVSVGAISGSALPTIVGSTTGIVLDGVSFPV